MQAGIKIKSRLLALPIHAGFKAKMLLLNAALSLFFTLLITSSTLMFADPIFPSPPFPQPPSPPQPAPPSGPVGGQAIYQELCAICHGKSGLGNERGYPLRHLHKDYATAITRLGRQGNIEFSIPMPAYDQDMLSDLDLALVMEYLHGFEQTSDGKFYYQTFCANCHGSDGRGGFSQRPVINRTDRVEAFTRWGSGGLDYLNRRFYMPRWNNQQISDEALEAIRLYIENLSRESALP